MLKQLIHQALGFGKLFIKNPAIQVGLDITDSIFFEHNTQRVFSEYQDELLQLISTLSKKALNNVQLPGVTDPAQSYKIKQAVLDIINATALEAFQYFKARFSNL